MAKTSDAKIRMPKKEMLKWLRERDSWDHNDWLRLLDELRAQGFGDWTDTQAGRDALGEYLESRRG